MGSRDNILSIFSSGVFHLRPLYRSGVASEDKAPHYTNDIYRQNSAGQHEALNEHDDELLLSGIPLTTPILAIPAMAWCARV